MGNNITIKNENTGLQRTVYTQQSVIEVAQAAKQASQAISRQEEAYIVRHPKRGLFLCIREGAGARYYEIRFSAPYFDIDGPGTKVMTDMFRFTGEPIKK